jgi:hypothetical protein
MTGQDAGARGIESDVLNLEARNPRLAAAATKPKAALEMSPGTSKSRDSSLEPPFTLTG